MSTEKGIIKFDPIEEISTKYNYEALAEHSISHDIVYCSFRDTKGRLWFGTQNGISRYDAKNDRFDRFKKSESFPISINKIFSIFEELDNIIISSNIFRIEDYYTSGIGGILVTDSTNVTISDNSFYKCGLFYLPINNSDYKKYR